MDMQKIYDRVDAFSTMPLPIARGCLKHLESVEIEDKTELDAGGKFAEGKLDSFRDFLRMATEAQINPVVVPDHHLITYYAAVCMASPDMLPVVADMITIQNIRGKITGERIPDGY